MLKSLLLCNLARELDLIRAFVEALYSPVFELTLEVCEIGLEEPGVRMTNVLGREAIGRSKSLDVVSVVSECVYLICSEVERSQV